MHTCSHFDHEQAYLLFTSEGRGRRGHMRVDNTCGKAVQKLQLKMDYEVTFERMCELK